MTENLESQARPTTPGTVYGVLSMVMLVLVAAVALSARQPPPPAIAEIAPQAAQQITEAPSDLASPFGEGEGGPGGSGSGATTTTTVPVLEAEQVIDKARVRQCIGDPPRQIEDFQSPPCVAYFDGDNGGATSKGVTANEIKVLYSISSVTPPDEVMQALAAFFNRRFEFYGRKIVLKGVQPVAGGGGAPEAMEADAAGFDQENPFAVIGYSHDSLGRSHHFYDALARRKVLSLQYQPGDMSSVGEDHLREFAPYQWDYVPRIDSVERGLGEMICNGLAGQTTSFAGATELGKTRKFGLIYQDMPNRGVTLNVKPLQEAAARCGVTFVARGLDTDTAGGDANAILAMKDEGVTSIVVLHHLGAVQLLQNHANSQAYQPEWILSHYINTDHDLAVQLLPQGQVEHTIALRSLNKSQPVANQPAVWAIKEQDPNLAPDRDAFWASAFYQSMLLLASGIQTAGPTLTPDTFQQGLFRTTFPNPNAGAAPYYQATVGFADRTHSMVKDFAPVWASRAAYGYDAGTPGGGWCYHRLGERYRVGDFPDALAMFPPNQCR